MTAPLAEVAPQRYQVSHDTGHSEEVAEDHGQEQGNGQDPESGSPSNSALQNQSMALNDGFLALEQMRLANLELEFGRRSFDQRTCTQCLREKHMNEDLRANEGLKRRTWDHSYRYRRRAASPCLVCASPVCSAHSSPEFRRDKVSVCGHCAPLFGVDFVMDMVSNEDWDYRRACVSKVVDSYDRAVIMLRYSAQYVDDVAKALEENTERNNKIGLGSSATGIVSGITGVAAAAVHIAAAAAAGAAIMSPAGPPLLIASIIFGGTAAAASSGSEAVSYYSEPNQLANRVMALHELVNALLKVTVVLNDALTKGHIDLGMYEDVGKRRSGRRRLRAGSDNEDDDHDGDGDGEEEGRGGEEEKKDNEAEKELEAAQTPKRRLFWQRRELEENKENEEGNDIPDGENNDDDNDDDDVIPNSKSSDLSEEEVEVEVEEQNSGPVTPGKLSEDKGIPGKSPERKKERVELLSSSTRKTIATTTTNVMKAAQVATVACGVLSITTIILEAKNMTDTLERMKDNKCEKADILKAIRDKVDELPDTSLIAEECQRALECGRQERTNRSV